MGKVLKIGLVGLGNIGKRHMALLSQIPEFELVAVCDADKQVLESYHLLNAFVNYPDFLGHCGKRKWT